MSRRVVIIEGTSELLDVLRSVLEAEAFDVAGFSGPDLTGIMQSEAPQLVMIDMMLPDLNGVELARQLRQSGLEDTPMIAMSASSAEVRRASRSALFQEVLAKPFDRVELLGCVRRYVH